MSCVSRIIVIASSYKLCCCATIRNDLAPWILFYFTIHLVRNICIDDFICGENVVGLNSSSSMSKSMAVWIWAAARFRENLSETASELDIPFRFWSISYAILPLRRPRKHIHNRNGISSVLCHWLLFSSKVLSKRMVQIIMFLFMCVSILFDRSTHTHTHTQYTRQWI